jgi:lipoprotein signal peptidase
MSFKNRFFWLAALFSLVADRLTKVWVVTTFDLTVPPDTVPLIPGIFHFTYVTNTGAAFSLFKEGGEWLRWLSFWEGHWVTASIALSLGGSSIFSTFAGFSFLSLIWRMFLSMSGLFAY